ncbi:xylulokinase [Cohaesibacter celericrescens]|uniref:Xylulose kinase n=1 Tax=Cohaesibacter celericrescens TaxID=2067669 RepID=A0A2N5XMJ8_9HYPH|nr:xylulokinase [Cohaesibacter celericrescens]PLW75647.1 xylulokinase [Cohaesibacter celericrescens]
MYLGIDLGTSGIKVLVMSHDQQIVATAHQPLTVERPATGWSEQDPASWITATAAAFDELAASAPRALRDVKAIGLSGHMHGATMLDAEDKPIAPCILWNDTRSFIEAAELDATPGFRELTGNIVFPGFTAPKLAWMRNNKPELFKAIKKVLLPKDYLRLWLTGNHVSDYSDSAGTAWLDVGKREWSAPLLSATGLDISHMPALAESTEATGTIRQVLADRWGFSPDVVVAGGAGDNAASALATGITGEGDAFLSLGTSGVIYAATNSYRPLPESAVHTFCHSTANHWCHMAVILAATDALNWYANLVGSKAADLTKALGSDIQGPGSSLFFPYLGGERTPHNDATIRGSFIGLAHPDNSETLTRTVLEGVSYAFKDGIRALEAAGTHLDRLIAVGGGSSSDYWLSLLATILDKQIDRPAAGDFGGAFGAARMGLVADQKCNPADVCTMPDIEKSFYPNRELQSGFNDSYARYAAAYSSLKDL